MNTLTQAYTQGYQASMSVEKVTDINARQCCPYTKDQTSLRDAWIDGFYGDVNIDYYESLDSEECVGELK